MRIKTLLFLCFLINISPNSGIDFPFEMTAQCDCDDMRPCLEKMQPRLPDCVAKCLATLDDPTDLTASLICDSEPSELKASQKCVFKPFGSLCNQLQGLKFRIPRRNYTIFHTAVERQRRDMGSTAAGGPVDEVMSDMIQQFSQCLAACTAIGTDRCFKNMEYEFSFPNMRC